MDLQPIRFSYLRTIGNRSPAHLTALEPEATTSMESGSAFHGLTLGAQRVIAYEDGPRRGKAWDAFEAANPDALIVTPTVFAKARAMADAVLAHPIASKALEGVREKTISWECMGLKCRSTPDVRGKGFVTELKQARTADPKWFERDAVKMAYHAQLQFYTTAIESTSDDKIAHQYIVAVEPEPPYVVQVFEISDRAKEAAEKLWRLWFERLKVCVSSNDWPPYSHRIEPIDVPDDPSGIVIADESDLDLEQIAA